MLCTTATEHSQRQRHETRLLFGLLLLAVLLLQLLDLLQVLQAVQSAHEAVLLLQSLESAVAELGRSIDELEVDGLLALDVDDDGLAQGDDALLGTNDAALEHDPVILDDSVVGEATDGVDALLGQIGLGGAGLINLTVSNLCQTKLKKNFNTSELLYLEDTRIIEILIRNK
jgi:hypothetical protein